ncbi:MAG: DUF4093 domain-containing protein [Oscillospiraceae bacterium]|nr:DUF4093 domain-containing protein [Oscillospiraceae bacterium]
MEKIKLNQVVLVEGKYDMIRLASLLDAVILRTDGFQIYKDKERQRLLRRVAERNGLIVLTDSDAAGFQIRNFMRGIIPGERLWHVYIPDILGKERRKTEPSKEGKLGVEGMETRVLREAFEKANVFTGKEQAAERQSITRQMLCRDGFSGKPGCAERRRRLLRALDLPERLSTNALAEILSACVDLEEYERTVHELVKGEKA